MTTTEEGRNKIVTFGCRLNFYESEGIKAAVKKSDQENLIIFNSCAVTSQAEQQLRQSVRKAKRENPDAKIVVTGCAAQIDPAKYAKMDEVDLVLGNEEKDKAESYLEEDSRLLKDNTPPDFVSHPSLRRGESQSSSVTSSERGGSSHQDKLFFNNLEKNQQSLTLEQGEKIKVNDIMSLKETAPQMVSYFENKTRAFLEIQNGCNHRCTFCIIPFGRGNSRSVMFGDIVAQTRAMVAAGHKEVVLTGVDISDYGKDLELKITLSQMIRRLLNLVPELPRLRLSSIDAAEIDDELLEFIATQKRFMPYLHISLQSGDDMILKRMKRRHTRSQVVEFCQKVRELRPEVTFGADIIAGFPTETDEMFENSLSLIKEAGIVFTHIFPYSKREGTPAAKMPAVNGKIVKERARLLREAGAAELNSYLQKQIGKKFNVIVEGDGMAKTENFLDVDLGECKMVQNPTKGEMIEVEITGVKDRKLLVIDLL